MAKKNIKKGTTNAGNGKSKQPIPRTPFKRPDYFEEGKENLNPTSVFNVGQPSHEDLDGQPVQSVEGMPLNHAAMTQPAPTATVQGSIPLSNSEPEAQGLASDQLTSFTEITSRLLGGQKVVKLCGYAGTGKTFLLARLAQWARRQGFQVTVAAPTHKAAGVISSKLGDNSIQVRTIHSLLGLRLEPDFTNDSGGRILLAGDGKSKVKEGLVICDEASMVGKELKKHIDSLASVRWLFVGDLAQLPPVGEDTSELLDNPDCYLKEVLRQAKDSEILNLATRIREGDLSMKFKGGKTGPNQISCKDVFQVKDAQELFDRALARFNTEKYRKDAAHCRMLVFRNHRREALNSKIRELLVGKPEPYVEGEWLVMYAAFGPEKSRLNLLSEKARKFKRGDFGYGQAWKSFFRYKDSLGDNLTRLHVSQEVLVRGVKEGEASLGDWKFQTWQIDAQTREEAIHILPVLQEQEVAKYLLVKEELRDKAQALRIEQDEERKDSPHWQRLDAERKGVWSLYFSLEETFAQVDYAYAMTVHKSQGSTFDHAFVDVPDLLTAGEMVPRILYTAVTRPAKSLTFYL